MVAAELSIESRELMTAPKSAANIAPVSPTGSSSRIITG